MDMGAKERFEHLWLRYFSHADLPVVFFYSKDQPTGTQMPKPPAGHRCVIGDLSKARSGKNLALAGETIGCGGGKRYLGFAEELAPNFEYFLSYGIPGKLEGERYKKSPELVKEVMKKMPAFEAPGRFIVFKRWDRLEDGDNPEVVIFFANPDVLSGVFTLTNFDRADTEGVIAPFGAGCSTVVQYPYLERDKDNPRAVLGMLDVSARPCVAADVITLAIPMKRFTVMVDNMEESFLVTDSWKKVKRRIARTGAKE
jgi:uncharacterized protein (DUF169 family)